MSLVSSHMDGEIAIVHQDLGAGSSLHQEPDYLQVVLLGGDVEGRGLVIGLGVDITSWSCIEKRKWAQYITKILIAKLIKST